MIISSLAFWTLVAGFLGFVVKFLFPAFPFGADQILAAIMFILGAIGIVPTARLHAAIANRAVNFGDLLKSLQFWSLLAGLISFVVHFYSPTFPFVEAEILALIVYVLSLFDVTPQLRAYNLLK
jgi:uncharacterized membrane protein HdeD (DUF308 family)